MLHASAYTMINPQNGNLAFKLMHFDDISCFDHVQRYNYFSLIWIQEGSATLTADFANYEVSAGSLLAFAPYQPFMVHSETAVRGVAIFFHSEFFCIFKHHDEISCNGVLYNNIYHPPYVTINAASAATLQMVFEQLKQEMQNEALAQYEILVSYLKIFLITASRLKVEQQPEAALAVKENKEPFILQKLKDAIESHYKTKHSPSEYAALLFITPKALARITKSHFNKTLSALINERIIIEAKRELYITNKPVKQIAYELGYEDEYYFSRFFKVNTDVSPQQYRDTVGMGRGIAASAN